MSMDGSAIATAIATLAVVVFWVGTKGSRDEGN